MNDSAMTVAYHPTPWNKGKLIGQKPPLKLREIWALRTRLEMGGKTKELALFNLAIDSKLRGCDLVQLRVNDGLVVVKSIQDYLSTTTNFLWRMTECFTRRLERFNKSTVFRLPGSARRLESPNRLSPPIAMASEIPTL